MTHTLTQAQFDVLFALLRKGIPQTQRELHSATHLSLGSVNATVRELEALGYIKDRNITDAGRKALAPYKVNNAIIMAAGLSSRFAPISYELPKGTLRVRGEVLIERQIRQLHEVGITDITVVVGYKKEHFFYLTEKYGVHIVVNEEYATRNNNSSLWCARDKLSNTYVCSSDNYFTENPFESHVYRAYYSAVYICGPTEEWCIETGPAGRITGATIGGSDSWTMLGHVYFDHTFSENFRRILEKVYHLPHTAPQLWESIYLEHIKELDMSIRKYPEGIINEFDSLDELRSFDPMFMENLDSEVFDHITDTLGCSKSDIRDFYPLKQGLTNLSCHFSVGDEEYVYRHPGIGTNKIVDREAEIFALEMARDLGLDSTFIADDPAKGWKISRFIQNARNLNPSNDSELAQAMQMSKKLHKSPFTLERNFDFVREGLRYESLLKQIGPIDVPGYSKLRTKVLRLKDFADADGFPVVPSHNDFFSLNFLVHPSGNVDLIDWEYAGMSDVAADFGTMVVCSQEMDDTQANKALELYFSRVPNSTERRHFWSYVIFAGWCWYVWALLKEAEGDDVGEWLFTYYRYASEYVDALLKEYENAKRGTSSEVPSENNKS